MVGANDTPQGMVVCTGSASTPESPHWYRSYARGGQGTLGRHTVNDEQECDDLNS